VRSIQIKGISMHKKGFLSHRTPVVGVVKRLEVSGRLYITFRMEMGIGIIEFRNFGSFTAADYRQDLIVQDYSLIVILVLVISVCRFIKLIPIRALLQFIEFTARTERNRDKQHHYMKTNFSHLFSQCKYTGLIFPIKLQGRTLATS